MLTFHTVYSQMNTMRGSVVISSFIPYTFIFLMRYYFDLFLLISQVLRQCDVTPSALKNDSN